MVFDKDIQSEAIQTNKKSATSLELTSYIKSMDYSGSYKKFFEKLKSGNDKKDDVYSVAVGGDYDEMGYLQWQLLLHAGLESKHHVVDVGCGTGRLAYQLAQSNHLKYTGFDVVEEFLKFAKKKCAKSAYRFETISGLNIPLSPKSADIVCFFSVFTHLLHEDSYTYLLRTKEILKDRGKVIFSFLTFDEDEHWNLFNQMIGNKDKNHHNQFMSNRQIEIWAKKLGYRIDLFETGSTPFIPISKPVRLQNGANFEQLGSIGQGVCIFSKP